MCKSVPDGYGAPALPAHDYPLGIKAFGLAVLIILLYSLESVPTSLLAAKQLMKAQLFYSKGDTSKAIETYKLAINKFPHSEAARIGCAEAFFKQAKDQGDEQANAQGLSMLSGVSLGEYDVERLAKVMPKQYWDNFEQEDKYSVKLHEPASGGQTSDTK
jgi:hypothetical protein